MNTLTDVPTSAPAAGAASTQPYPGPRAFRPGEEALFYGRSRECADLVDLLLSYRAVVLYAQSGAGKSSLVNAGVLPELRKAGIDPLPPARVCVGLPPGLSPERVPNLFLFSLLASWLPSGQVLDEGAVDRLAAADLRLSIPRAGDEPGRPTLIVIDQFEELFRACPEQWPQRMAFCEALGRAMRADSSLRLLIVIREDYIAELDPYAHLFPDALRIRYRLERLREPQALEAIVTPASRMGVTYEEGVAKGLVGDLRRIQTRMAPGSAAATRPVEGEFVEPVHLQVVCEDLWRRKGDAAVISAALVKTGDVDSALIAFYERAVLAAARLGPAREADIRQWVEGKLITPARTRGTVYRGDRETAGLPNAVVEVLEHERIIRVEPRAGAAWYELTHDRFIGPIRASNREWRQRRRRRLVRLSTAANAAVLLVVVAASAGWLSWRRASVVSETTSDADSLRALASEVEKRGDAASLRRARDGYTSAIEAYARSNQPVARARALLDRARVSRALGRSEQALADYREARTLYVQDSTDPTTILEDTRAFGDAGRSLYLAGMIPDGVEALQRASTMAAVCGTPCTAERATTDSDLSLAIARTHDYAGARAAFDRVLEAAGSDEAVRESVAARLGATIANMPRTTQAYGNLARLLSHGGRHLEALSRIDTGIVVAKANDDPILATLRADRVDVLMAALPAVERHELPELSPYICRHNAFVVGASVPAPLVEKEVRMFRRDFPLARAGSRFGDSVQILVDGFLTCEEAGRVVAAVEAKYGTAPFVGRADPGCPACPGLPGFVSGSREGLGERGLREDRRTPVAR